MRITGKTALFMLAALIGLLGYIIGSHEMTPEQVAAQASARAADDDARKAAKVAEEQASVASFTARSTSWRAELDRSTARGFGAVGTGNLDVLSQARDEVGKLFIEISQVPQVGPAWVAPCEHAAGASLNALKAAMSGNMSDGPDSFGTQSRRYLAAITACRKATETAQAGG